jgi:hypothetical protein
MAWSEGYCRRGWSTSLLLLLALGPACGGRTEAMPQDPALANEGAGASGNGSSTGGPSGGCAPGTEYRPDLAGLDKCRRCGGADEPCCAAATCRDGGCCVNGFCAADSAACGGPQAWGQCQAGQCRGCGEAGQACCGRAPTGAPPGCAQARLVCDTYGPANGAATECVACGGPGQPCCGGGVCADGGCCSRKITDEGRIDDRCEPSGGTCSNHGGCSEHACGSCGKLGQPCCRTSFQRTLIQFCSAPFTDCSGADGRCLECGALGQPACPNLVCQSGQTVANPFICVNPPDP